MVDGHEKIVDVELQETTPTPAVAAEPDHGHWQPDHDGVGALALAADVRVVDELGSKGLFGPWHQEILVAQFR
jgi:hypothetical protein